MYTTSRYASTGTRELARSLAKENGEEYLSRGKKTIEQLAQLARKKGESQIKIVEEKEGNPSIIATLLIDELGHWKWSDKGPIEIKKGIARDSQ